MTPGVLGNAEAHALDRAFAAAATEDVPHGPNPRVGAVVLDGAGAVVGIGHHRGAGTAHAEVVALQAAGVAARGGTVVVTLEPCSHTGRTGPCTRALIDAGVRRVVYAVDDPNPQAAGGAHALREAGIDVVPAVDEERARALNEPWHVAMERGRPFVTAKMAMTLDGRVAAADGSSRWITSEQSRRDVHLLRSRCQAIVTGTGTVLADDPQLTVRDVPSPTTPVRVVVGRRPVPPNAHVLDDAAPTLVMPTHDPAEVLEALAGRGVVHVMVESGPTLATAWIRAGVVDELVVYVAAALLGDGRPAFGSLGVRTIGEAMRMDLRDVTRLGPDVRLTSRLAPPAR